MKPANHTSIEQEDSQSIFARIDAQDVSFIVPIREYLTSSGCSVSVNRRPPAPPHYHVVAGNAAFVKRILEQDADKPVKRLVVLWGGPREVLGLVLPGTKVVSVDAALSDQDVSRAFNFFFTGESDALDLRRHDGSVLRVPPSPLMEEIQPVRAEPEAGLRSEEIGENVRVLLRELYAPAKGEKLRVRRKRARVPMWIIATIAATIVVASPVIWYAVSLGIASVSFIVAAHALERGNLSRSSAATRMGRHWVEQARFASIGVSYPLQWLGLAEYARAGERIVSLLTSVGRAEAEVEDILSDGKRLASVLFSVNEGDSETPMVHFSRLRNRAAVLHNQVGLATAQLTRLLADGVIPSGRVRRMAEQGKETLVVAGEKLSFLEQVLTLYPVIGGFEAKKTYLLLFQNSMELRPAGGFIGSIGILILDQGKMVNFEVKDVYTVDGQLKGHVDPPRPIRELLRQEHWYLRDSNWDPDFRKSGERAAWFYEKETGTKVDGVVAISLPFFIDLLTVTGPLDLADYPDRITAENFFGKALFYTQSDFFPGSTQKKDFLGSTARALLAKLMSTKDVSPRLLSALHQAIAQRDIQWYGSDPNLEDVLVRFGWGGVVWGKEGCAGGNQCLFAPLLVTEANLGVNKANAFVTRSKIRQAEISEDGRLQETVAVAYRNTSRGPPTDAGGTMRTVVQFFAPPDVAFGDVMQNGSPIPRASSNQRAALAVPSAEAFSWEGGSGMSVAFDVPAAGETQLTVSYTRQTPLVPNAEGWTVEFFDQKQAGQHDETARFILRYPVFWQAAPEAGGGDVRESVLAKVAQLEYNTPISGDRFIRVRFTK